VIGSVGAHGTERLHAPPITIVTWRVLPVNGKLRVLDAHQSDEFSRAVVALIKQARQEKQWSQAALAKKAGVSRTGVTMVENGDRRPTLYFCHALAKALDRELSEFVEAVERGG
jgi:DNA-binding XRE family transcriptional regulator